MGLFVRVRRFRSRFAGLARPDKRLIVESWLDALLVKLQLRSPWRRSLFQALPEHNAQQDKLTTAQIQHLAGLVDLSFQTMPATCLERALVLQRLLRRRGVAAALQIGVRKQDGVLEAHAWLEHPVLPLDNHHLEFQPLRPGTAESATIQWQ